MKKVVLFAALSAFNTSFAADYVQQISPNKVTELCQKPQMFPYLPNDIEKDDNQFQSDWYRKKDFENIDELCSVSFYQPEYAICPKLFSTNPGVEIHKLTKTKREDFEKTECPKTKDRSEEKYAKFKQTVTCSKTASILSYYHVSRWLGNALHVPISSYRTMDKAEHAKVIANAKKYGPKDMQPFWGGSMNKALSTKGQMVTVSPENKEVIYGAIADNPNGEEYHQRLNGSGSSKEARIKSVQSREFFTALTSSNPIAQTLGVKSGVLSADQFQSFVHSLDASNQMLIDHIMEQEDRYGNIHQKKFLYYIDAEGSLEEVKKEKDIPEELKKSAIAVNRILLKDNDCGMRSAKAGSVSSNGLIKNMKHMDPITYSRLQWLAQILRDEKGSKDTAAFLADVAVFTKSDFENIFKKNVLEVADKFKALCKAGNLHLDLDLEAAVKGQLPTNNKNVVCE